MKLPLILLLSFFTTAIFAANQAATQAANQAATPTARQQESALFAGGCFWCMEPAFDKLDGVISTTSGYTAGHKKNPTYKEVSAGDSGHTEAMQVIFDPEKISYAELLEVFWKNIDPVAVNRQFCDSGTQYRSGIYYLNKAQEVAARQSLLQLERTRAFEGVIATEIVTASTFYPAEDYHQDYYQKNPIRYKYYRYRCGRDQRLEELWPEK